MAPFIPHSMYRFFTGAQPDEFWLKATQEWLKQCHVMVVLAFAESSSGTQEEIKLAKKLNIPVFHMAGLNHVDHETAADLMQFVENCKEEGICDE